MEERRTSKRALCSHFDGGHNRGSILDPLVVRNVAPRTSDDDLTSPDLPGSGEDGTVRNRLRIPVCGYKVHVFAESDAAIVDGERGAGTSKFLLYGEVSGI